MTLVDLTCKVNMITIDEKFSYTKGFNPQKSQTFDFLTVLKNYPPKSAFLVTMSRIRYEKLPCVNSCAQSFLRNKL